VATSPGAAAKAFDRRLDRFERTASKLERALDKGTLTRRDLEALYEGLFIGAIVEFESFLELLFMGVVLRKTLYPGGKVTPRIDVRSQGVLEEVLLDGRRYVDWFPYALTETRAQSYLRGGRPFSLLSSSQKQSLERWLWIRNAVAHSGRHARQVFERKVIGTTPLPPRERTPAGFLRSEIRSGVTRFEHTLDEMRGIAATLCT
jgi:hypothetical protein